MATAILVAGMHRSGTSAATGALQLAGVSLGGGLLAAASDNPKGYFENERAVQIHERLLSRLGSSWDDVRILPPDWAAGDPARDARNSIRELIETQFAKESLWAVKDPRICRFIPLWRDVLEELGISAVALMVVRKPAEVAASIAARNGWALPLGELLWMRHVFEAEAATRDIPRTVLSYDDLLEDPNASLRNALERLQVPLPMEAAAPEELNAFVDNNYQHHKDIRFAADPFQTLMDEAYAELVSIARGAHGWLRVREVGAEAESLLSHWEPYIEAVAAKAARHRSGLLEAEAAKLQIQSQLNAQIAWSEGAVEKEQILHDRLAEATTNQQELTSALHAVEATCTRLGGDVERLETELKLRTGQLAEATIELAAAKSELSDARSMQERVEQELRQQLSLYEALLAEKSRLHESLRVLAAEKIQLEATVLDLETSHRALAMEKQQLEATVASLAFQLEQVLQSHSWKLTRPLRGATSFFRSLPPRLAALRRGSR